MRTQGISPKVWVPTAVGVLAIIVHWVATGEFNRTELAESVSVAGYALIGYLAGPGEVIDEDNVEINPDVFPSEDDGEAPKGTVQGKPGDSKPGDK